MFPLQVVTELWPNFIIRKFCPPGQTLGVPMHPWTSINCEKILEVSFFTKMQHFNTMEKLFGKSQRAPDAR